MASALPGGLNPDNRGVGQHIPPFLQENVRIVLIGGQLDGPAEFLDGPRMLVIQDPPPQGAAAPQGDLLFHQTGLDAHIAVDIQI